MSSEHEHAAEEFARRLASLTPAATFSRDQLLYEAGRNAERRQMQSWRFAASIMIVGMIGLLAFETLSEKTPPMVFVSPKRTMDTSPNKSLVQSSTEAPNASLTALPASQASSSDYLQLRNLVLLSGVEAMPRAATASDSRKRIDSQRASDKNGDGSWWRLRVQLVEGASL